MRFALLIVLLCCSAALADEKFVVSETLPGPAQVKAQPIQSDQFVIGTQPGAAAPVAVSEIHDVLTGILSLPTAPAAPAVREFLVYTPPPESGLRACGACDWMKTWGGSVLTGGKVTYRPGGTGPWPEVRLLDVPNHPKTGKPLVWHEAMSRQRMEQLLAEFPAPTGTITVGSVKGKAQVEQMLKALNSVGPGEVTVSWKIARKPQLGTDSAALNIPTTGTATYRWSPDQMELAFKPPLMMVAGSWLKFGQQVQGATLTRDKVTILLPGMIDLAKRLE